MSADRAYDLSTHQRVIGVESSLITGRFLALGNLSGREEIMVTALDAVIWDDEFRHSGLGVGISDISGRVSHDGIVTVHARGSKQDVAMRAIAEIENVMRLVAEEFRATFTTGADS